MPSIKVITQTAQSDTAVTGTQNQAAVSLDGALTVAMQVDVSNSGSLASATAKMQVSADPTDVAPSHWNDYGDSQNVTGDGSLYFERVNPTGNWIRMVLAAPTGQFDADIQCVVKGPN